jgi:hypothetical protein
MKIRKRAVHLDKAALFSIYGQVKNFLWGGWIEYTLRK